MRVCLIGSCGHVRQALRVLRARDDIVIVGAAAESGHEDRAAFAALGVPLFEDWRAMLDALSPDLAVISPVFAHTGKVIEECAKRKIDIFSEKPVAASLDELERVESSVKASGIRFCAMHYLRYSPAFYHGAELVRSGEIGEVRMITAQKSYKYGTRPSWYAERELYGGTIPWVGIHAIDWIYHFSGKNFVSVSAQSFGKDPEMAALCQFELDSGAMASVNIDYYRPQTAPTHGDDRIRCVGERGVLEVRDGKIYLLNRHGSQVIEAKEAPELLSEFLDGKEPISAHEIFYLTKVALMARDSADKGVKLSIAD